MDNYDPFAVDDDYTLEEQEENDRIEAANRELWRRRIEAGWIHERDGKLRHPGDFDIWMNIDPFSRGLILSEKLNRILQEQQNGLKSA